MDVSDYFTMFENWVHTSVLTAFATSKLGAAHVIYGADVMFMCAVLAAAAYTVVVSVDRANYYISGSTFASDGTASGTRYGWYYLYGTVS